MYQPLTLQRSRNWKTGYPELDAWLDVEGGLITLKGPQRWLSWLAYNVVARNAELERTALYVQWLDYHERYWALDYDRIMELAKRAGTPVEAVEDHVIVLRTFSRDAVEEEGNWDKLSSVPGPLSFILLDSINGFYAQAQKERQTKPAHYSIGRFARLCMEKECTGIVLDASKGALHPTLGELSSAIVSFSLSAGGVFAKLEKHPFQPQQETEIDLQPQRSLTRYMR